MSYGIPKEPGLNRPDLDWPVLFEPGLNRPGLDGHVLDEPGLDELVLDEPGLDGPGLEKTGLRESRSYELELRAWNNQSRYRWRRSADCSGTFCICSADRIYNPEGLHWYTARVFDIP